MVDLGLVFLVVILAVDFVISIWNAYASGLTLTLMQRSPGENAPLLPRYAAYAGLGLAFAGMAYVMTVVFGFLAYDLAYLDWASLAIVLAFDFLVFGAMIIGFGLVVTAQSIAVAWRRRSFGAIAVSVWNVFAEVWDVAVYAEGFRAAYNTMGGARSARGRGAIVIVILIAVLVAFFITYAAYRHGVRRANQLTSPTPSYSPFGRPSAA